MLSKLSIMACSIAIALSSLSASGQTRKYTGTLLGRVVCADTLAPARFATVRVTGSTSSQSVRTDYNGSFTVSQLVVGLYVVDATYPGYIDPAVAKKPQDILPKDQSRLGSVGTDLVDALVAADQSSEVTILLTRGASVSGHISYQDGGPAIAVSIQAVPLDQVTPNPNATSITDQKTISTLSAQADSQGRFVVDGLTKGRYTLKVELPQPGLMSWFLGDTPNAAQASTVTVVPGQVLAGYEIHLPSTVDTLLPRR